MRRRAIPPAHPPPRRRSAAPRLRPTRRPGSTTRSEGPPRRPPLRPDRGPRQPPPPRCPECVPPVGRPSRRPVHRRPPVDAWPPSGPCPPWRGPPEPDVRARRPAPGQRRAPPTRAWRRRPRRWPAGCTVVRPARTRRHRSPGRPVRPTVYAARPPSLHPGPPAVGRRPRWSGGPEPCRRTASPLPAWLQPPTRRRRREQQRANLRVPCRRRIRRDRAPPRCRRPGGCGPPAQPAYRTLRSRRFR